MSTSDLPHQFSVTALAVAEIGEQVERGEGGPASGHNLVKVEVLPRFHAKFIEHAEGLLQGLCELTTPRSVLATHGVV